MALNIRTIRLNIVAVLYKIVKHLFSSYFFFRKMGSNPWHVESIQDFSFLNCPECTFKSKHEDFFQEHAVKSHPQSRVLFDENIEIDPLQEVKVATHGNVEYYVEVKKGDFHAKVNSKLMFLVYMV